MKLSFISLVVSFCFVACHTAFADVTLPSIFSDNMVLQQDTPTPIWGLAEPGENILVQGNWQPSKTAVIADKDGKWLIRLKTPTAGGPYKLIIEARNTIVLNNVMIGEVWLCSGQSNMFMPIGGIEWAPEGVEGADDELAKPEQPMLRLFCDDQHPLWKGQKWQVAKPDTLRPFSGTAYFFGSALLRELKVPVGLINICRGGSPIQQWTPKEYNEQVPITKKYSGLFGQYRQVIQEYNQAFSRYYEAIKNHDASTTMTLPTPLPADIEAARSFYGSALYDNLIAPIIPYAIRGIIWYQGESNSKHPEIAQHYDEMLQSLITGWRAKWEQPKLPFYFVQLPGWDIKEHADNWVWTRQSMLNVCQDMMDVGMAVIVDVGEPKNLHPPQKKEVGERLAMWALAKTYNKSCIYSGPLPLHVTNRGKKINIYFETFGSSLNLPKDQWSDLEVAGQDGIFYPATARIKEWDAVLSCPQVYNPTALRYGWKPFFRPTLFNKQGLPASPFFFIKAPDGNWNLWSSKNIPLRNNLMFTNGDLQCAIDGSITHGENCHKYMDPPN